MVGANSAFAAIFFFPSNDLFKVERKGCFFNPFRSLLVCAFFISSGKNRQNTQRRSLRAFSFREGILKRLLVKVKTNSSSLLFKGFGLRKHVWKNNKGGAALNA